MLLFGGICPREEGNRLRAEVHKNYAFLRRGEKMAEGRRRMRGHFRPRSTGANAARTHNSRW